MAKKFTEKQKKAQEVLSNSDDPRTMHKKLQDPVVMDAVDEHITDIQRDAQRDAKMAEESTGIQETINVLTPATPAKGKYFNAEKNAKRIELEGAIATALEEGDIEKVKELNTTRTALFASSGRSAITKVEKKPAEFLKGKPNGELRIVLKVGNRTFCGTVPASRWNGKDRKYLYFDLKKHGLL